MKLAIIGAGSVGGTLGTAWAQKAGHEIFFQACSEECCAAVSSAIRADLGGPN